LDLGRPAPKETQEDSKKVGLDIPSVECLLAATMTITHTQCEHARRVKGDNMKVSLRVGFGVTDEDGQRPYEQVIKDVAGMGYDAVELMLMPGPMWGSRGLNPWSPALTPEDRAMLAEVAKEAGVMIGTLSADWAWGYSQYCPDLKDWGRGVEILKGDIAMGQELGASVILVHFGSSTSDDWGLVRAIATELAEAGEAHQVKVGFEGGIFARVGLGGLEALSRLIDEVDSPWFGAYEHCYWPRGEQQPHEEIALMGKRIVCLHSGRLNFEHVDYGKMCAALKEIGYDDYWVFEVEGMGLAVAEESKKGFDEIMAKYW
jgi:L-ribulose-5-phosphate 3-epimerase